MIINVNNLKDYILENSTFASKKTIDLVTSTLTEELKNNNFNLEQLEVTNGESSISFMHDKFVIKLTYIRYNGYNSISDYVSHSDAIIQPEFEKKVNTGEINYPTILKVKKLQVGNVTEKERDETYIKLRKDGYLFNDAYKLENFGKDEDGNVYLIDYGELIYIKNSEKLNNPDLFTQKQYEHFIERELKYHVNTCPDLDRKYRTRRVIQKKWLKSLKENIRKTNKPKTK